MTEKVGREVRLYQTEEGGLRYDGHDAYFVEHRPNGWGWEDLEEFESQLIARYITGEGPDPQDILARATG